MAQSTLKKKRVRTKARGSGVSRSALSRGNGVAHKSTKSMRGRKTAGGRAPTAPTAAGIAEREAVARTFFNPKSAAAARAAFLKRQQPAAEHAK